MNGDFNNTAAYAQKGGAVAEQTLIAEVRERLERLLDNLGTANNRFEYFADRVLGAVADIGMRHSGERALVITHGWPGSMLCSCGGETCTA